jgi:hypothetical protein
MGFIYSMKLRVMQCGLKIIACLAVWVATPPPQKLVKEETVSSGGSMMD